MSAFPGVNVPAAVVIIAQTRHATGPRAPPCTATVPSTTARRPLANGGARHPSIAIASLLRGELLLQRRRLKRHQNRARLELLELGVGGRLHLSTTLALSSASAAEPTSFAPAFS